MPTIAACFAHAGWPCDELEPGAWRSTFTDSAGDTHELYVLATDDWVHLAVSPFLHGVPAANTGWLHTAILRLNQDLRFARLALDADGDINLLADLPAGHLSTGLFAAVLELLAYYTDELAPELRRLAADPESYSPPI